MELISVVGSAFLSSLFQALFEKLSSHDLLKYVNQGQVLSQIKKWESTLKTIYAVLDDAEEQRMTNQLVNDWVTDLRDLAYDVDDILDEFATEALRQKMGIKMQPSSSKVRKLIPSCFSGENSETRFNAELVSKMEEITTRLEEISTKRSQLHLNEEARVRGSRVIERPPTTSLVDETKVKGRESDHKAVVELLNKEGSDARVRVISIVGMGGVGKTTLAQLIINDANLEFDLKEWLCVGDDFHIVNMTKTLLQNLGGYSTSDGDNLNLLQLKLMEKLSGKKFLIVLDDVWTENYDHWTLFRSPFEAGAQGSRIIVTTRNRGVSSMMGGSSTLTYPLELLSDEDCLSVLAQHALEEPNFHTYLDLRELGLQIVKRCKGLPLAAKAIGGLLRGKPNPCSWEEVLNDEVWDIPEEKSDILPALRLSYYHLPSHLKRCFAYCAIFPRDFEFEKNDLKLLWMAEGLLQEPRKTMKQRRDLGEEYFNELFSRCFFQKSSSKRSTFVMHDLINNLAKSVSGGVCSQLDDKMKNENMKVRHSSFMPQKYEIKQRFEVFYHHLDSLRTFLTLRNYSSRYVKQYHITSKVLLELLPKLKCLRVLSLSGYSFAELSSSIGNLKHLRYLNLTHSNIERLPESVGELINLQTLILHGCKRLIELPLGTCNLVDLTHLDISGTENLRKMPPKFGQLSKLCTLSKFIVGDGSDSMINELQKFTHLQGQLQITNLQNVVDIQDAKHANLHMRHCLDNLLLDWDANFIGSQNEMVELQVLNSLQPHENLEELTVKGYGGMKLPMWIGDPSFKKMIFLELNSCSKITSLPPLGQLPFLVELIIKGIDGVKEVGAEFLGNASPDSVAFPSLETLTFERMSGWETWCWSNPLDEDVAKFPKLTNLCMSACPKLIGKFPSCLPSLRKLEIFCCPQLTDFPKHLPFLDELVIRECQEVVLRSVSSIASLTTLRIGKISGLESLHHSLNAFDKVSSLKRLDMQSCHQLVSLEDGENGLFPCNLEELMIYDCSKLENLPNELHNLRSLKALNVWRCPKLVSFPATGLPYNLRRLVIEICESLKLLPEGIMVDTSNRTSYLEHLSITGCESIMSIPTGKFPNSIDTLRICYWTTQLLELLNQNEGLSRLTRLAIVDSPQLELFPVNGLSIPNLTSLTFKGCKNLRSLPNHMDKLISLRHLGIESCTGLESFPKGGFPPNLITIDISGCSNLSQPMSEWGLHRLNSLIGITIEGTCPSTNMVCFPDKDGRLLPDSLTFLCIWGLKNLKFISSGLLKLTSLQSLVIWCCPELRCLPKEGLPASLGDLNIRNCPHLKKQYSKGNQDHWAIISHIPHVHFESTSFTNFQ